MTDLYKIIADHAPKLKDNVPDLIIIYGADSVLQLIACEKARDLVDYYLTLLAKQKPETIAPGFSVTPYWQDYRSCPGAKWASKGGVHHDAIVAMAAAMIAGGLLVSIKYDS